MRYLQALFGALAFWLLAIIGALGVSIVLQLSDRDSVLLVVAVGMISFFGTFLPMLRLFNRISKT